jgi:hypothetical protein
LESFEILPIEFGPGAANKAGRNAIRIAGRGMAECPLVYLSDKSMRFFIPGMTEKLPDSRFI